MQEKNIYYVFLVWMEKKNISRASCSKAVTRQAALRPRCGFSHSHQEHMKYTYNHAVLAPQVRKQSV